MKLIFTAILGLFYNLLAWPLYLFLFGIPANIIFDFIGYPHNKVTTAGTISFLFQEGDIHGFIGASLGGSLLNLYNLSTFWTPIFVCWVASAITIWGYMIGKSYIQNFFLIFLTTIILFAVGFIIKLFIEPVSNADLSLWNSVYFLLIETFVIVSACLVFTGVMWIFLEKYWT